MLSYRKLIPVILMAIWQITEVQAAPLELPISWDKFSSPLITLEFDGKVHSLMLDTGSSTGLHLSKEIANDIKSLKFTGQKRRSTNILGEAKEDAQFIIKNVTVNGEPFHNIEGAEFAPWGVTLTGKETPPEYSVIGLGFFHDHRFLIDYGRMKLTVIDKDTNLNSWIDPDWVEVPFQLSDEGLILTVEVGGKKRDLVLDTGSTISIIKSDRVPNPQDTVTCSSIYPALTDEKCTFIPMEISHSKNKDKIYAMKLDNIDASFTKDGLLGGDFFKKHAVLIDFVQKKLFLRQI
ncbi:hypothetical protein [Xenorhabdus sp. PB62.4]|uniref:hypothetical protein n=1 Tax=Xenorhabdus sp. PB62.4 TaxID=1851573 RepID=UPI0016573EBE|nr:hypothetical protein [Xenorhabdus sp. PB62.4]MBC8954698.1 hypothetical protein [Xenorhabdus sp. PB62.4]